MADGALALQLKRRGAANCKKGVKQGNKSTASEDAVVHVSVQFTLYLELMRNCGINEVIDYSARWGWERSHLRGDSAETVLHEEAMSFTDRVVANEQFLQRKRVEIFREKFGSITKLSDRRFFLSIPRPRDLVFASFQFYTHL